MITAFELYCVLKLDSILNALFALATTSTASSLILLIAGLSFSSEKDGIAGLVSITQRERALKRARILRYNKWIPKLFKSSAFAACLSVFFWALFTLTPTTNQMAAIMVIPKIATSENVEVLTGEAKSLYDLAKEYFRESVKCEKKTLTSPQNNKQDE